MARQPGRGTRARGRPDMAEPTTEAVADLPAAAAAGTLLDNRYRLVRQMTPAEQRWAAVDQLLDRPVEVRYLLAPPERFGELLAASSAQADARWLRVLDAGPAVDGSWVVLEDPCRPSLLARVREGRLDPAAAVELAIATAQALRDAAPAAPATLTPDRVYVDDGGIRLDPMAHQPSATNASADPVRSVGRLLLFSLTGVWTGASAPGLISDPDAAVAPRRHRGGVSRRLDALTAAAASGRVGSLDELLQALDDLPKPRPEETGQTLAAARRIGRWALPPLLVAVVGIVAWTVGSDLGAIPGADLSNPRLNRLPAISSGRSPLVWTKPPRVSSFDPLGDNSEDAAHVAATVDGNLSTVWHTNTYSSDAFGGLKPGVGVLIDLGRRDRVAAVQILLTHPGAALQVRAGGQDPHTADALHLVRTVRDGRLRIRLRLQQPVTARYWLVWLTRLPAAGGGYSEGIREIRLERPRGH